MPVRRGTDIKVLYDTDKIEQSIAVQRVYRDTVDGSIQTPVTPLLLAREELLKQLEQASGITFPPIGIPLDRLRTASVCFANPGNVSGESNFTVILPWHPLSLLKNHLREIGEFPGVLSIKYQGES